uniref:Uncharacterized protein n=1 Tax=Oryza rufipogon TaxID=4529 RepID=A0A0E0QWJ9_ORYRU
MIGFNLPANFIDNLDKYVTQALGTQTSYLHTRSLAAHAQRTHREYSAPSALSVPVGASINTGDANFEIKMGLITMVHSSPFCGKSNEDANPI